MAKKRHRSQKISKGERRSIAPMKKDFDILDKLDFKLDAWKKGKNPWVTIYNSKDERNRPFIRVKANNLWGNPKTAFYNIFGKVREN